MPDFDEYNIERDQFLSWPTQKTVEFIVSLNEIVPHGLGE